MENIIEKSKKIHKDNVDKGFWDNQTPESRIYECLALIHSEISETLEAHRKNEWASLERFKDERDYNPEENLKILFERYIKETVEDEIADTSIRILDLLGALDNSIDYSEKHVIDKSYEFSYLIYYTHKRVSFINTFYKDETIYDLIVIIEFLEGISNLYNIDLEKHIELKLQYNKMRGYKHGKNY